MNNEDLIEQYRIIHREKKYYGTGDPDRNKQLVARWIRPSIKSILDYGCGKGYLIPALQEKGYEAEGYDPAIPEFAELPSKQFDAVVSFDVLEHLLRPTIRRDLQTIASLAKEQIIFGISCRPAAAILPNGINAHTLVLEPYQWYRVITVNLTDWHVSDTRCRNTFFLMNLVRKNDT